METSIARLTAMVSDLLDMSRLQTGAVAADRRRRAARRGRPRGARRRRGRRARAGRRAPDGDVDAGLLERVVANLVANALRHSDAVRSR